MLKNIKNYAVMLHLVSDYRPRNNIVKDENGDMFTECQIILACWMKHFSQLTQLSIPTHSQLQCH